MSSSQKTLLAWISLGMLTFLLFLTAISQRPDAPTFKVGECIVGTEFEEWNIREIERIEQIGNHSYRRSFWNDIEWTPMARNLTFDRSYQYRVIKCPKSGIKP